MSAARHINVVTEPDRVGAVLNPLRRQLMELLGEPDSASGLARRMDMPRQQVNYHLRELERCGFVECVQERKKGNCIERIVQATARAFVICPTLLGDLGDADDEIRDRFSSTYLIAGAARMLNDVAVLRERADKAGQSLPTLTVQADVRFPSAEARDAFAEELTRTVAEMVSRYHDDSAPRGRLYRFMIGGHPVITHPGDTSPETAAREQQR